MPPGEASLLSAEKAACMVIASWWNGVERASAIHHARAVTNVTPIGGREGA